MGQPCILQEIRSIWAIMRASFGLAVILLLAKIRARADDYGETLQSDNYGERAPADNYGERAPAPENRMRRGRRRKGKGLGVLKSIGEAILPIISGGGLSGLLGGVGGAPGGVPAGAPGAGDPGGAPAGEPPGGGAPGGGAGVVPGPPGGGAPGGGAPGGGAGAVPGGGPPGGGAPGGPGGGAPGGGAGATPGGPGGGAAGGGAGAVPGGPEAAPGGPGGGAPGGVPGGGPPGGAPGADVLSGVLGALLGGLGGGGAGAPPGFPLANRASGGVPGKTSSEGLGEAPKKVGAGGMGSEASALGGSSDSGDVLGAERELDKASHEDKIRNNEPYLKREGEMLDSQRPSDMNSERNHRGEVIDEPRSGENGERIPLRFEKGARSVDRSKIGEEVKGDENRTDSRTGLDVQNNELGTRNRNDFRGEERALDDIYANVNRNYLGSVGGEGANNNNRNGKEEREEEGEFDESAFEIEEGEEGTYGLGGNGDWVNLNNDNFSKGGNAEESSKWQGDAGGSVLPKYNKYYTEEVTAGIYGPDHDFCIVRKQITSVCVAKGDKSLEDCLDNLSNGFENGQNDVTSGLERDEANRGKEEDEENKEDKDIEEVANRHDSGRGGKSVRTFVRDFTRVEINRTSSELCIVNRVTKGTCLNRESESVQECVGKGNGNWGDNGKGWGDNGEGEGNGGENGKGGGGKGGDNGNGGGNGGENGKGWGDNGEGWGNGGDNGKGWGNGGKWNDWGDQCECKRDSDCRDNEKCVNNCECKRNNDEDDCHRRPLTFCIDTTGSVPDGKRSISNVAQELISRIRSEHIPSFQLVTFNDVSENWPGRNVKVFDRTHDIHVFAKQVKELTYSGGLDPRERLMQGLLAACRAAKPNTLIITFSDNGSKNLDLAHKIIEIKREKHLKIFIVLTPKYQGSNDGSLKTYASVADKVYYIAKIGLAKFYKSVQHFIGKNCK